MDLKSERPSFLIYKADYEAIKNWLENDPFLCIESDFLLTKVYLRTIVKLNNILGNIYFILIKHFHRLFIPNIL